MSHFLARSRSLVLMIVCLVAGGALHGQSTVRIATWNIEALGSPGSGQWNDAVDVVQRMGADVVAIQEVAGGEQTTFPSFASQAGYANQVVSSISGTMSGNLRLAVMSTYPIVFSQSHSAVDLSGDPNANDITRDIFEAHIQVTGASTVLGVFVVHLKAGSGNDEDFRRTIELIRVQQALSAFQTANPGAPFALVGDMNEDIGDGPFGSSFSSVPGGCRPATTSVTTSPFRWSTSPSRCSRTWASPLPMRLRKTAPLST